MMNKNRKRLERLAAVFITGCLLFNYPILYIFSRDGRLWGFPTLYVFIFVSWFLIIALTAVIAERAQEDDQP
ncbi:MAG: hypothetical protein KDE51_00075 [Anaerolineales bacterium]|nr:hypothetical protein [Anaerolineales bacterium]